MVWDRVRLAIQASEPSTRNARAVDAVTPGDGGIPVAMETGIDTRRTTLKTQTRLWAMATVIQAAINSAVVIRRTIQNE